MTMNTDLLSQKVKTRFDHAQAKRILREKYQAKMIFAHANGMWQASPELLTVLNLCKRETAVIADMHDTPVEVNVSELSFLVDQRWQEQMNAWLAEFNELKKQR